MNLCVTEDRGITCRYYIGQSVRIKEYIVTTSVTMVDFFVQNLHLLIHK